MGRNQMPGPYTGGHTGQAPFEHVITAIRASTDVTALAKAVIDAYELTVSLELDRAKIDAHYSSLRIRNSQSHEQVMFALEKNFSERAMSIEFIRATANKLMEDKQYEIAHSIVTQLMEILKNSPINEAFARRMTEQ